MQVLPLASAEREIFSYEPLTTLYFRPASSRTYSAEITNFKLQPSASSHYQQLPHVSGHGFPQRANDIVSQTEPQYNSILQKTQNLHVEIFGQILGVFVQFLQIGDILYVM